MRKRRYSLPQQEAEIVRLALRTTLQEMANCKHADPYWRWYLTRAEDLLKKLETYQWEVEDNA